MAQHFKCKEPGCNEDIYYEPRNLTGVPALMHFSKDTLTINLNKDESEEEELELSFFSKNRTFTKAITLDTKASKTAIADLTCENNHTHPYKVEIKSS